MSRTKNTAKCGRPWPGIGVRGKGGFTLIEVLVVLAIMVILFGLLFAPMIAGMNLVRRGRQHVAMQDAVRLAVEQMKRELADAVYVFAPDVIDVTAVDGNVVTMKVVDYSSVVFAPAQRDAQGRVVTPVRPETLTVLDFGTGNNVRCFRAVRYRLRLADDALNPSTWLPASPHGPENPFVVVREEGYVREDPGGTGRWVWWEGNTLSSNVLTPRSNVDIVPTVSICTSCGSMWTGYTDRCLNPSCPDYGTALGMKYLSEGVQFVPKRIVGEVLRASEDGTLYRARWGGWLGTQNNGEVPYTAATLPLSGTELNPHIRVYRYEPPPGAGDWVTRVLDTVEAVPSPDPNLVLRWSSGSGGVRFGQWHATGAVFNVVPSPPNGFYPLIIDCDPTDAQADAYDSSGTLTSGGAYTQDLYPVYPPAPSFAGEPRAPITYVIDPTRNGTKAPAKIVPSQVSVRLLVQFSGGPGSYRYYNLQPTSNYDQSQIGRWQFCAYPSSDQRTVQVRFSRDDPPSPDWFGGAGAVAGFAIQIRYYSRHNFDPVSNKDDIVVADYSTRYMMNISLTLGTFVRLEPSPANMSVLVLPQDVRVHRMQARDQVVIRNGMD